MLDLVLGGLLVVLGIRGWMRGLVKEVVSLAVLVVGTVAAFRLSTPLGRVFAAMSGASPDASRYVAGIAIFLGIAIAAAVISRILHMGMRFLPGVSTVNRVAGAGLSVFAFALVVTLAVSLATVAPLPEAAAAELDDSAVAASITDPNGVPQRILGFLSGDRVVEISLRIQSLTGSQQVVAAPGKPIEFDPTDSDDLDRLPAVESVMVDLLNRERVSADVDPVLRSSGLDEVALELAMGGYRSGTAEQLTNSALRSLLDGEPILSTQRTQVVVLAASPEAAHVALADQADSILGPSYTKVGIAAVRGPVGLLIVEILAG